MINQLKVKKNIYNIFNKNKPSPNLETFLNSNLQCSDSDIILLDSSILSFNQFFKKTDFLEFEKYQTNELLIVKNQMEEYLYFINKDNIFFTKRVFDEIESLRQIISFRLKNSTTPPNKKQKRHEFRYKNKNYEKANTNKNIYKEIQEISYRIYLSTKQKYFIPKEEDHILFNIINTISSNRKLKENKIAQKYKIIGYKGKSHDNESKTDEWLVSQAYNKILFDDKKVTLLSNDDDLARIVIDTQYYLNSPFLKGKVRKIKNKLRDEQLIFGSPRKNICSSQLNKPELYDLFGYVRGNKEDWKQIYDLIKEDQKLLIKQFR